MGADVAFDASRDAWFDKNIFQPQPYMCYGVKTDEALHPLRGGKPILNTYAAGSTKSVFAKRRSRSLGRSWLYLMRAA